MANPVVHFEIVGTDAEKLHNYYHDLFGWEIDKDNPMNYGVVPTPEDGGGIGGGICAMPEGEGGHVTFYVYVDDVSASLAKAEELGGSRVMGPEKIMDTMTVALFKDPEGHMIGMVNDTNHS